MTPDPLIDCYRRPGDWLSLYLDADALSVAVGEELPVLDKLFAAAVADGAPPGLIDQAREALRTSTVDEGTVAVFVRLGEEPLVVFEPEPPRADVAYFGDLPYLLPLLEFAQSRHAHAVVELAPDEDPVLVTFDREGEAERHRLTADESSDRLATQIHDRLPDECGLVAVHGRPGAAHRLGAALDERRCGRVLRYGATEPDRSEAEGLDGTMVDTDDLADEVVRQVANLTAEESVAVLSAFRTAADDGRAVDGTGATVRALHAGATARLLLHDDPDDRREAWFFDRPAAVYTEHPDVEQAPDPYRARRGDVLARAALLQGASVRVLPTTGPGGPAADVGAILDRPATEVGLVPAEPVG